MSFFSSLLGGKDNDAKLSRAEIPMPMRVEDIEPATWNARAIDVKDLDALKKSIQQDPDFLWLRPILVRKATMQIYAGAQRWLAAKELGYQTVPVVVSDITEEEAKTRNLKDNNHHGRDTAGRDGLLNELKRGGLDLSTIGRGIDLPERGVDLGAPPPGRTVFTIQVKVESEEKARELTDRLYQEGYAPKQTMKKVKA